MGFWVWPLEPCVGVLYIKSNGAGVFSGVERFVLLQRHRKFVLTEPRNSLHLSRVRDVKVNDVGDEDIVALGGKETSW